MEVKFPSTSFHTGLRNTGFLLRACTCNRFFLPAIQANVASFFPMEYSKLSTFLKKFLLFIEYFLCWDVITVTDYSKYVICWQKKLAILCVRTNQAIDVHQSSPGHSKISSFLETLWQHGIHTWKNQQDKIISVNTWVSIYTWFSLNVIFNKLIDRIIIVML